MRGLCHSRRLFLGFARFGFLDVTVLEILTFFSANLWNSVLNVEPVKHDSGARVPFASIRRSANIIVAIAPVKAVVRAIDVTFSTWS